MARTVLDIFGNALFGVTSLTEAINVVPNNYGRLNQLGLFRSEPIPTTTVAVQFANGTLNLLPTRQRGGPPSLGMPEKRSARQFGAFHIPHDDMVLADDVQNIIARTADDGATDAVAAMVNRKLEVMRRKHGITLEHLRMGALRGTILDSDGSTLLNLYTEFGVSQNSVDFVLGTTTTDVRAKTLSVVGYAEDNLMGETMTGLRVFCSPEFWVKFISHPSVVDTFKAYDGNQNPLRADLRSGFTYMGAVWEEYRGAASYLQEDGTYGSRRFVPAGEAIAFPEGTTDMFTTYFAPADFIDTVNTMGDEIYARQEVQNMNRNVKIHTQSNPLPLNKRPNLVQRIFSSN